MRWQTMLLTCHKLVRVVTGGGLLWLLCFTTAVKVRRVVYWALSVIELALLLVAAWLIIGPHRPQLALICIVGSLFAKVGVLYADHRLGWLRRKA